MNCSSVPVEVVGVAGAAEVATSSAGSCARLDNGHVACWGFGSPTASEVAGVTDAVEVTMAQGAIAIVRRDGSVWTGTPPGGLARLASVGPVQHAAIGGLAGCVLLTSGAVVCWGSDEEGQLGNGSMTASATPMPAIGINDAIETGTGQWDTCVRRSDSTVWCWGADFDGQAGRPCVDRRSCAVLTPAPVLGP